MLGWTDTKTCCPNQVKADGSLDSLASDTGALSSAMHTSERHHRYKVGFSTESLRLPTRLSGYVTTFRALQPHRLQPVSAMLPEDVLNEPLFFNRQVTQPLAGSPAMDNAGNAAAATELTPDRKPLMLSAGITKVAHPKLALQQQQSQLLGPELRSVLFALPSSWQTVVSSAPAASWFHALSTSGRQVIQHAQTVQLHTVGPHWQLLPTTAEPISNPSPVQVISWLRLRPCRLWKLSG